MALPVTPIREEERTTAVLLPWPEGTLRLDMDIATIGGLILGVAAIAVGFVLEGGHLSSVFQGPALMIVIGGTLGASMVTTSFQTLMEIPRYMKIAMFGKTPDPMGTIEQIVKMAERARREGVLGLERDVATIHDPFFKNAMQLVIDGTEVTVLNHVLENEVANIEDRHKNGIILFTKMGGFSPTMGILGTVLGLIHTLANTADPGKMASSIAAAFIATLWGVGLANLLYLPIADKLRFRHDEEMLTLGLVVQGATAIQSGENPRVVRNKLLSFLKPTDRPMDA
jgi:chemotaxis protein MotA